MSGSRQRPENLFVQSGVERLYLFGTKKGDPDELWIEAKKRISYRESQELMASIADTMLVGGDEEDGSNGQHPTVRTSRRSRSRRSGTAEIGLDLAINGPERILTWVLDWNFSDAEARHVPFGAEAVDELDPVTATEIHEALNDHIERYEKAGKGKGHAIGPAEK